jgi:hypothetical protein
MAADNASFFPVVLLLTRLPPGDEIVGEVFRNRHFRQTSLCLSVGPNLSFVDRLHNGERDRFNAMALPPEREQLAWPKSIRHIELEQNPVTQTEPGQGGRELFPT